jgi:ABC-2 type transport system ATP-binding protein
MLVKGPKLGNPRVTTMQSSAGNLIIKTHNLSKEFDGNKALRQLNLEVFTGEIFGIVGPDGAGKTTIMRILAGILKPTSGDAWIDGISVVDSPDKVKEKIAYMPQRFGLYQDMSVIENLYFYADLFRVPQKARPQRLERLFAFSRLEPFKDRPAGALSGGMKQKLALACALIHSPDLLLLDEPTNGVDPISRRDFWKILYDLVGEGISIFVSTAYLDEADRTHRVALMANGSIMYCDEPATIKAMMKGAFFELIASDTPRAREVLLNAPGVIDLNLFGEGLHIRLEDSSYESSVRQLLQANGTEILSLRSISPAMEDAFLSLIREGPDTIGSES